MSWLRYSDDFTDWPEWDHATSDAFRAYVVLVQACSRGKYWDGHLPKRKALGALMAHLDDPQEAIERLAILSLVHEDRQNRVVILPRIDEHVPPKGMRDNAENSRVRMRRKRKHDAGDHSMCSPAHCEQRSNSGVTDSVTRNTGTGRDGTGLVQRPSQNASQHDDEGDRE